MYETHSQQMQESKEQLLKLRCEMFPLQIYKKNLAYFDSVDNFNCDWNSNQNSTQRESENCPHAQVLIVDDDMFNILALQQILKLSKLTNMYAINGEEAIDIVKKEQVNRAQCKCQNFKLILMDLNMPVMGGIEATKELLRLMKLSQSNPEKIAKIIIIGCSAYGQEKQNCVQIGMTDFIVKPITAKKVQEITNKYLPK